MLLMAAGDILVRQADGSKLCSVYYNPVHWFLGHVGFGRRIFNSIFLYCSLPVPWRPVLHI
jgi:hypothetical protein